jgi:hypothetical protein
MERLDALAEERRLGDRQRWWKSIDISTDEPRRVGSHPTMHAQFDRLERLEHVVTLLAPVCIAHSRTETHVSPAGIGQLPGVLHASRTVKHSRRGKALHPFTVGAAEKLVDRHAK